MTPAISQDKNEQVSKDLARGGAEFCANRPGELSSARRIVRKGKHLDVDGILARSLPQTYRQLSSR